MSIHYITAVVSSSARDTLDCSSATTGSDLEKCVVCSLVLLFLFAALFMMRSYGDD
jgi:hypothetical protein